MSRPVLVCLSGWACQTFGEDDVKGGGGRAYTQNGRYNHKYHFFIGTTLNGGIWQSKFRCKTPASPSGRTDRTVKCTVPPNEHRGRTWMSQDLRFFLGLFPPRRCDHLGSQRAVWGMLARPLQEILAWFAKYISIWRYVTLWQIVANRQQKVLNAGWSQQMSP